MSLVAAVLGALLLPQQPELTFHRDQIAVLPHGALGRRTRASNEDLLLPERVWRLRVYVQRQVAVTRNGGREASTLDDAAVAAIRGAVEKLDASVLRATDARAGIRAEYVLVEETLELAVGAASGLAVVPQRSAPLRTSGRDADSILLFWPPGRAPLQSLGITVGPTQGPDGVPASGIAWVPAQFADMPLAEIVLHEWAHQIELLARERAGMPWLPGVHDWQELGYASEAEYLPDWLRWYVGRAFWLGAGVERRARGVHRFADLGGDPWRALPLLAPLDLQQLSGHADLELVAGPGFVVANGAGLPAAGFRVCLDQQIALQQESALLLPAGANNGQALLLVRGDVGDLYDELLSARQAGELIGVTMPPRPARSASGFASGGAATPLYVFSLRRFERAACELDLLGPPAEALPRPTAPAVELWFAPGSGPPVLTRRSTPWRLELRNLTSARRELTVEWWLPPELRVEGAPEQLTLEPAQRLVLPLLVELEPDRPCGEIDYRLRLRAGDAVVAELRGTFWSAVGRDAFRSGFEPARSRSAPRLPKARGDWSVALGRDDAAVGAAALRIQDGGGTRTGAVELWRRPSFSFDLMMFPELVLHLRLRSGPPPVVTVDIGHQKVTLPLPVATGDGWQRIVVPLQAELDRLGVAAERLHALWLGVPAAVPGNRYRGEDLGVCELDEVALVRHGRPTAGDRLRDLTERYAATRGDGPLPELVHALAGIEPAELDPQDLVDHQLLERALAWRALVPELPPRARNAPIGRERFAAMLRLQHHLDQEPEEWLEFGWREIRSHQQMLQELADRIAPRTSWRDLVVRLRERHPSAEELPAFAERAMRRALQFAVDEGIVTVPMAARDARIQVVTSGELSRTYPFGGYGGARPGPDGWVGTYFVSPPADWMDAAQAALRLRGNHETWTRVVALHEIVPGHHLQTVVHLQRPLSPFRRSFYSTVFAEGWALYCEEAMWAAGFFPDAEARFTQLQMRLWRAVRVVVDVSLHLGTMSPAQAEKLLVDEAGLDPVNAGAEVLRYLDNPTRPMSYLIGYRLLEQMVAQARARSGAAFRLDRFLDSVLAFGPVPLPAIRRAMGLQ